MSTTFSSLTSLNYLDDPYGRNAATLRRKKSDLVKSALKIRASWNLNPSVNALATREGRKLELSKRFSKTPRKNSKAKKSDPVERYRKNTSFNPTPNGKHDGLIFDIRVSFDAFKINR